MNEPTIPSPNQNKPNPPSRDVFAQQAAVNTKKKKRSVWKTFFKGLGVLTLVGVGAGAAFLYGTKPGQQIRPQIGKVIGLGITLRTDPDLVFEKADSNIVNVLLIGRDTNWKIGKVYDPRTKRYRPYQVHDENASARSDTMIVVSLNKERKTVTLVSIPRDSIVRIPGHGRTKLNAAHAFGGPDLLIKTLHDELGLTIHHYAVIQFDGFKKLIDKMGGVTVDVDGALMMDKRKGKLYRGDLNYDDNWGNLHVHLKPGLQLLNGDAAHAYIRFREDREGDPGRIRRQQQVMKALAKGITQQSPFAIPGLIEELKKQFKTDPQFSETEMASAGWFAKAVGGDQKIQPLTLFAAETGDGNLTLNRPKNEKLLSYIFGDTFNADHFLVHSPETTRDDLGPANNAGPQALKILRAAGVLGKDQQEERSPILDAPRRLDASKQSGDDGTLSADTGSVSGQRYAEAEPRIGFEANTSDSSADADTDADVARDEGASSVPTDRRDATSSDASHDMTREGEDQPRRTVRRRHRRTTEPTATRVSASRDDHTNSSEERTSSRSEEQPARKRRTKRHHTSEASSDVAVDGGSLHEGGSELAPRHDAAPDDSPVPQPE